MIYDLFFDFQQYMIRYHYGLQITNNNQRWLPEQHINACVYPLQCRFRGKYVWNCRKIVQDLLRDHAGLPNGISRYLTGYNGIWDNVTGQDRTGQDSNLIFFDGTGQGNSQTNGTGRDRINLGGNSDGTGQDRDPVLSCPVPQDRIDRVTSPG